MRGGSQKVLQRLLQSLKTILKETKRLESLNQMKEELEERRMAALSCELDKMRQERSSELLEAQKDLAQLSSKVSKQDSLSFFSHLLLSFTFQEQRMKEFDPRQRSHYAISLYST